MTTEQLKHTPGPWWVTDSGVRDRGGYIFHTNPVTRYEGQEERYAKEVAEREANRHAASALPELLATAAELDRLMLVIESAVRWQDPAHHSAVLALVKANRTVLAKATGATHEQ